MRRQVFAQKCLCLFLGLSASLSIHAAPYEIIDLGVFDGSYNFAFSINNLNQVTGNADGALIPADEITEDSEIETCLNETVISVREFCNHAYLYDAALLYDLGALDTNVSFGTAINDNSTVVGYASETVDNGDPDIPNPSANRAFVSYDGQPLMAIRFPDEIADLPEGVLPNQRAIDISNNDLVVGYSLIQLTNADASDTSSVFRPFVYDLQTDTYTFVPLFSDNIDRAGGARAINEAGEVVGWANSEDDERNNPTSAFYWNPANPELSTDLGSLGGFTSAAYDINDNGIIVGVADTDSRNFFRNETLAFYYDIASATMTQIPEFSEISDYKASQALAVNNMNQVVGSAQVSASSNNINAAYIYQIGDDSITNLNDMIACDLGWNLVLARDINDAGYIVGTGTKDGDVRSFMLIPTSDTEPTNCTQPQPTDPDNPDSGDSSSSSMGMFVLLLAGFVWIRRRFSY